MRTILFLSLALLIFSGCKKDSSETEETAVKPENAVTLSKAVSVWHGVRVSGTPPAPTNSPNSPVLNQQTNNQTVLAINGRYAVIQPEVISGSVAGYYLQVNGASDYFKVDYSKPRNVGGRYTQPKKGSKRNFRIFGTDSTGGGNLDSAIVISIPSTIQAGTFCATYCVYDAAGNISNPITVCVTVSSFGGDASVSYLTGAWRMTAQKDDASPDWELLNSIDTSFNSLTCVNNRLAYDCPSSNCDFIEYAYYIFNGLKADFTFGSDGALKYEIAYTYKTLNLDSSTCSNLVYSSDGFADKISGAWSYTAETKKLVMVFDLNSWGEPEPEAYAFTLEKINDKLIYLHDPIDDVTYRFEK